MSGIQGKLCMLGHSMTELLTIRKVKIRYKFIDERFYKNHLTNT